MISKDELKKNFKTTKNKEIKKEMTIWTPEQFQR